MQFVSEGVPSLKRMGLELVWYFGLDIVFLLFYLRFVFSYAFRQLFLAESSIIKVKRESPPLPVLEPVQKSFQLNDMYLAESDTSSIDGECLDPLGEISDILVCIQCKVIE